MGGIRNYLGKWSRCAVELIFGTGNACGARTYIERFSPTRRGQNGLTRTGTISDPQFDKW